MSTALLVAAVVAGGACAGGEEGTTPSGDRVLTAVPNEIKVNPNETGTARFVLTSGGVPIVGQRVTFSIVDDPGLPDVEARGATLVDSSATTDGAGVAAVDLRAGLAAQFHVRANAGAAQGDLLVIVVAGPVGNIVVEPFFSTDSSAAARATGITISFFENTQCADLVLAAVPKPPRGDDAIKNLPASGGTARFDFISTSGSHAVVGVARDAETTPAADACVDLPGDSLIPGGVVEVQLLLRDVVPDPVGRFAINSTFIFVPPLAASASIAGAWRDLGDCPLDPAQMFLDCTIDALSPETLDDPLDCKPNVAASGEGVLGDALTARRGIPIADGTGTPTGCRAARDMSGAPSLETIAMGLYGTPTPPLVIALPAIGNDAAHLLDTFKLLSTLEVASAGRPDEYVATHTLVGAMFTSPVAPGGAQVSIAPLALPATTAYTTAITRDGLLVVDSHGFSLRLGQVARLGFGAAALEPRGVAGGAGGLITALAGLAHSDDGTASGCAAFDRALCAAVGRAPGCLAAACPAGLSAMAKVLDSAFDAADGTGLDLYLSGSAPLTGQSNGSAYQLGGIQGDPTAVASWSVDLRTAAGRARTNAIWAGVRN